MADDVRRGRRRVARTRALTAGGVALAAAGVVLTAALITRDDPDSAPQPAPSPTETHSPNPEDTAIDPAVRDGAISDAHSHFGLGYRGGDWLDYDPVTDTGLLITPALVAQDATVEGVEVVGPTGVIATITCGSNLPCAPEYDWLSHARTLGPGADEITAVAGDHHTAQVIGHDGTVRRTVDLTPTIDDGAEVGSLRWSPDGSRLAVVTSQALGETHATRVWVVDPEGGDATLAYSVSYEGGAPTNPSADRDGEGAIWTAGDWGWSPDGRSLLLDVYRANYASDVVVLHLQPDGALGPVTGEVLYHSNRHFDWHGNLTWSPDGSRIAVRTRVPGTTMKHRVTVISAEDGSVLAEHTRTSRAGSSGRRVKADRRPQNPLLHGDSDTGRDPRNLTVAAA